jgi:peroxiredoxin
MTNLLKVDWSTIPQPKDDGGASHLMGMAMPSVILAPTSGNPVNLSILAGRTVLYIYPMTGQPNVPLPEGWDLIPGARGCTPQSCAFRDHYEELKSLSVNFLFGLSTQASDQQIEAAARLHLPFPLLSDAKLHFADALKLPRFKIKGHTFLKRLTMIIENGFIKHVIYPVFPPDQNAEILIKWLSQPSLPNIRPSP